MDKGNYRRNSNYWELPYSDVIVDTAVVEDDMAAEMVADRDVDLDADIAVDIAVDVDIDVSADVDSIVVDHFGCLKFSSSSRYFALFASIETLVHVHELFPSLSQRRSNRIE